MLGWMGETYCLGSNLTMLVLATAMRQCAISHCIAIGMRGFSRLGVHAFPCSTVTPAGWSVPCGLHVRATHVGSSSNFGLCVLGCSCCGVWRCSLWHHMFFWRTEVVYTLWKWLWGLHVTPAADLAFQYMVGTGHTMCTMAAGFIIKKNTYSCQRRLQHCAMSEWCVLPRWHHLRHVWWHTLSMMYAMCSCMLKNVYITYVKAI